MYSKKLFFLLLLVAISFQINAQNNGVCGLPVEHDHKLVERLKANIEWIERQPADYRSGDVRYVPVVFHIMRKSDGTAGIQVSRTYDQICNLNTYYQEQGTSIQFMVDEINYIDNTNAYTSHFTLSGQTVMDGQKKNGRVNIYIPQDADSGNPLGGIVLGYYDPNYDWIVMRPSEVSGFSSTLHHEMGHFLSLEHPFRGWDYEAYDPGVHGVQVGNYAPSTGYNFNILNEKQDGSNCGIAGDLICDTPPDYNHFSSPWGCNYNGGAKDPNGTLINPDETNIMSYFNSCDPKVFSAKQIEVLNADLSNRITSGSIQLLSQSFPGAVPQMGELIEPVNEEIVSNNANIFFDWPDVANATHYYLEVDRIQTFSLTPERFTVTDSEYYFDGTDLLENTNYYWRVRAYHAYDYCSDWSPNAKFKSSVVASVGQLEAVKSATVFPNPAQSGEDLILNINSQKYFRGTLQIFNASGQKVVNQGELNFLQGENSINLQTSQLGTGIYFLSVLSNEGIFQTKLVIQ